MNKYEVVSSHDDDNNVEMVDMSPEDTAVVIPYYGPQDSHHDDDVVCQAGQNIKPKEVFIPHRFHVAAHWTIILLTWYLVAGQFEYPDKTHKKAVPTSILHAMHFNIGQRAIVLLTVLLFVAWQPYAFSHLIGKKMIPKLYIKCEMQEMVLRRCVGFMLAVVVAMFSNYNELFPRKGVSYSRVAYGLIMGAVLVVAWHSRAPVSPSSDPWKLVLNRQQTEEWKGWLQIAFVLYHYMGANEIYVYYPVRVYVGSYVWLTGFGNFSFFITTEDFSLKRILKMMIRINLLTVAVQIAIPEISYMQNYICAMHSIFFLMVWLIMRVQYTRNEETGFMILKLSLLLIVLIVMNEVITKEQFYTLWSPLKFILGHKLEDWRYRFQLDGYSTWYGMVCAFFMSKLKTCKIDKSRRNAVVVTMACAALLLWGEISFSLPRSDFLEIHRYTSLLPITAYVILRNATPLLREWYLPILSWVGRHALEIYILQWQLFMDNKKGTAHLSWSPDYPLASLVINSMIVTFFAKLANEGTLAINQFLFPFKETYGWTVKYRLVPIVVLLAIVTFFAGWSMIDLDTSTGVQ